MPTLPVTPDALDVIDRAGRAADELLALVAERRPGMLVTPELRRAVVKLQHEIVDLLSLSGRSEAVDRRPPPTMARARFGPARQ